MSKTRIIHKSEYEIETTGEGKKYIHIIDTDGEHLLIEM